MKHTLSIFAALFLSTAAFAHGVKVGDLEIIHPNIPQPAKGAKAAGGYMAISNEGAEADRLLAIETPIAGMAMLHESKVSDDGVATMTHLEGLEIPAGETVVLEPGGLHIMMMGLTGTLTEGDMIKATLTFEHTGKVEIEFMVDPPGGVDHSKMDHSTMDHSAN